MLHAYHSGVELPAELDVARHRINYEVFLRAGDGIPQLGVDSCVGVWGCHAQQVDGRLTVHGDVLGKELQETTQGS